MSKHMETDYLVGTMHLILVLPNKINRGSYMSVHVLLNLLNELEKRDKM